MTWKVVLGIQGKVYVEHQALVGGDELILASAETRPEANRLRDEWVAKKEAEKKADLGQKELW